MTHLPVKLSTADLVAWFSRNGDRFVRTIGWKTGYGEVDCLLQSVPGTSTEEWPADPPLQQVVLETFGAPSRSVAFGLGMTGPGHWSLASEVVGPQGTRIQFDWACRVQRPAEHLGTAYQTIAGAASQLRRLTDADASWEFADGRSLNLTVTLGRLVCREGDQRIAIEPVSDIRTVGTHCWRYCFWVG